MVRKILATMIFGAVASGAAVVPAGAVSDLSARRAATSRVVDLRRISRDVIHGFPPSQDDTQVEPSLAVDPQDSGHEVAAFQDGRYPDGAAAAGGFATTFDGGQTWTTGVFPDLTWVAGGTFERSGDQVVAFGADGTAYAVMTAFNGQARPARHTAIAFFRAVAGGLSWEGPFLVVEDRDLSLFHDNPSIAVDTNPSSPHFGRIYATWIREHFRPGAGTRSPIVMSSSDDGGSTWSAFVDVSLPTTNNEGAHPLVQPDGSVTVVWQRLTSDSSGIVASTSTDGGQTFDLPTRIQPDLWGESPGMRTGFGLPASAVDPATGDLYVVWQDRRFRRHGLNDVLVVRSADGGATWSEPLRVNGDPADDRIDHFTPVVAANNGVVAACYRTRPMIGPGRSNLVDERCAYSEDGGLSFVPEIVLGPASDIRFAATALPPGTKFLGDYSGVTVSNGVIHAAWARSSPIADMRGSDTGHHQSIWAATILF